jgi:hypothetical protein
VSDWEVEKEAREMAKHNEPLTLWVVIKRLCWAFFQGMAFAWAWGELERIQRKREEERDKRITGC